MELFVLLKTSFVGPLVTSLVLSPILLFIVPILRHRYKHGHRISYWHEKSLPIYYPYTKASLVEMYIAFGCLISFREVNDSLKNKLVWINDYLNANFPEINHDVSESYEGVRNNGLNLNELIYWCSRKVSAEQRIKLVEYLVELAYSNEDLNSNESVFIFFLMRKWEIDVNELAPELQEILLGRNKKQSPPLDRGRLYYCSVLEVSETATLAQIKRAYRKLVKIYHPDNHLQLSEAEKKIHVAKFIEVQRAYEILISLKDAE